MADSNKTILRVILHNFLSKLNPLIEANVDKEYCTFILISVVIFGSLMSIAWSVDWYKSHQSIAFVTILIKIIIIIVSTILLIILIILNHLLRIIIGFCALVSHRKLSSIERSEKKISLSQQ